MTLPKPTAYVINLDRRHERWTRTCELWSPWFDLVRVPAYDLPGNGALGCKFSHQMVAERYLLTHPMVVVLEDDAVPTASFEKIGLHCLGDAEHYCEHWDYINLGPYLDCTPIKLRCASLSQTESSFFLRSSYSQQTHFVCYNGKSLPLLESALNSHLALDVFLGLSARHQWVPKRLLATQADGPSDIIQHTVDFHKPLLYRLSEQMLEKASQ